MKAGLLALGFLIVLGFFGMGFWASYQEVQNPSPTPAPLTELDVEALQINTQLEHQKDATAKISAVAVAGYSTIASLEGMHTFRDIAVVVGICFVAWVWLQSKRKDGGK